jgi:hypothetical protein
LCARLMYVSMNGSFTRFIHVVLSSTSSVFRVREDYTNELGPAQFVGIFSAVIRQKLELNGIIMTMKTTRQERFFHLHFDGIEGK